MYRFAAVVLLLAAATSLPAQDLYVSPDGNDNNAGTQDAPVATIGRAIELMREQAPGTIWLASGEYQLDRGITLVSTDGGNTETPVVIQALTPRGARITGAKPVADFRPISPDEAADLISEDAKRHVLVADLEAQGFPALGKLPDKFRSPGCEEVIFGDQPMQSARWPNEGFATFNEVIDAGASKPVHWVTREVYRPGSFRFPTERAKHWDISRGVYLHGFWCYDWADEVLKVASYNAESGELRLAAKHAYGIGNPWNAASERQFYAIGVFEEIDQPGEYYLDREANKLYFWPPSDVSQTPVLVSLCRAPLLKADRVSYLTLKDLVFENSCGMAIQLSSCTGCRIENCLVRNMGLAGISSSGGSDNHIVGCEVTRTGSRAISMYAGDRKTLTPGKCSVVGCHLHHLGRYDWGGGRGVSIGGCGNRVANNLIHNCPTGGVSYGGNDHVLELNEVHHVCEFYSDVGVFYTGRDWASRGNIVRWNYIHSITNNGGHGSQAIYLDDCDSGDLVEGNIVFGGVGRGVLLGGGRDNTIRGNIFIDLPKGIHVDARGPRGITLDKPGSWNLKAKCEAVDYLSPLWRERYPRLTTVLDNSPLLPMGNVMRDNIFIDCDKVWALAGDVKEEWLTRENNHELTAADFPGLPSSAENATLDLSILPEIWKKVPNFKPIPIERIGLEGIKSE